MSEQEANRIVVKRLYEEVISQGRFDVLDEIVADDAVDGSRPRNGLGVQAFRRHVEGLRATVTEIQAIVTDTVAEGDRVVVYWTLTGVQHGGSTPGRCTTRTAADCTPTVRWRRCRRWPAAGERSSGSRPG
jgi:predicted SnoaL-like aldol condensation-catalyzing enzyme